MTNYQKRQVCWMAANCVGFAWSMVWAQSTDRVYAFAGMIGQIANPILLAINGWLLFFSKDPKPSNECVRNAVVDAWESATRAERIFFEVWLPLRGMKAGAFIDEARHARSTYYTLAQGNSERC